MFDHDRNIIFCSDRTFASSLRTPSLRTTSCRTWPIALMLAIEVLGRVPWPRASPRHTLARYVGTGMVAIVAAILSYRHMAGLLATWGEDALSAYLGPLAVDGLMILAAAALLTTSNQVAHPR